MEEQERKRSFRKGLALGVCLVLLVMSLTGCAASYIYSLMQQGQTEELEVEAKVQELNRYIDQFYLFDYETDDMEEGVYKGLMAGLGDVYTNYYTAEEFADLMEQTTGEYSGIGAILSQNYNTGIITVVRAFAGSPAEEAGLCTDDILYKVNGEEVTGKDLSLVVVDLKGEEGTTVDISILRGTETIDLTLERRHIEVPTVEYEMLTPEIGYILITEFDDVTDEQFFAALNDLEAQGMKKMIVDLRDNPGGVVDVTCKILDRLLPEGLIVYTEDKYGEREEAVSDAENYYDGEMVVLVNGNSASASEIFAGAVKDYGIGTLVGTQTFGKGLVQSVFGLSDGSAVKITVSRYYTPNGNHIHEVGIEPDIVLEYDYESEEDNQLQKAIELLENP